ncbi:MAG: hemerythrin domain-containing protein [Promethearchaeota archaeon]
MKPIGLLLREHRFIERQIKLIVKELKNIKKTKKVNSEFIQTSVDFFITYADRTHHRKEEDILFGDLKKKKIPTDLKNIIERLEQDHQHTRKIVTDLSNQNSNYFQGKTSSIKVITNNLEKLVTLYPVHIETEDKEFFYPSMDYFTEEEQQKMLQEFYDFDKKMIHEKYLQIIEQQENED